MPPAIRGATEVARIEPDSTITARMNESNTSGQNNSNISLIAQ
jgi:hypothetical protein